MPVRSRRLSLLVTALAVLAPSLSRAYDLGVRVDLPTGTQPYAVATGDFDSNGHLDVVTADLGADKLTLIYGDGEGDVLGSGTMTTGDAPSSVVVADLNHDGLQDIVTANALDTNVSVFLRGGFPLFHTRVNYPVAVAFPSVVKVQDLDGDDHPDLVVGGGVFSSAVSVLLGDGTGAFGPATNYTVGNTPSSLALGDLNEDGTPDLVTGNSGSSSISVLLGDGAGGFGPKTDYATGSSPKSVALGDLDNDGSLDMAAVSLGTDLLSVWMGDGTGAFGPDTTYATGVDPIAVAIVNVDFTTKPEILVVNQGNNSVLEFRALGSGGHYAAWSWFVGTAPRALVAEDVNRDGLRDLIVANEGSDTVSLLLGGTDMFGPSTNFSTWLSLTDLVLGDLTGDGALDVAISSTFSDTTGVVLIPGDGAGGLGPREFPTTTSKGRGVTTGDFNGDTHLDLVTVTHDLVLGPDTVSVLLGDGAGGLLPPATFFTGNGAETIAAGYMDADAKLDLVTADLAGVSVLLGNGAGGFGAPKSYSLGGLLGPTSCPVLGDLNGDARTDVVVASDSTVSVLLNTGSGNLGAVTMFPARPDLTDMDLDDLDGDGDLDLAVASSTTGMYALLGNGAGAFGSAITVFTQGNYPDGVSIGDLNGDGRPDIAGACPGSAMAIVNLGDGQGGFGPVSWFPIGSTAGPMALGDLTGDGRADLVGDGFKLLRRVPTHTTLTAGSNVTALGAPTTLTAEVSVPAPDTGTPTGSVDFFDGTTFLGTATIAGGVAELVVNPSYLGIHTITAVYRGDNSRYPRISDPVALRVLPTVVATVEPAPTTEAVHLAVPRPNPAWASTTLAFGLPRESPVSLGIYDVSGRLVRTLANGAYPAGSHVVPWDLRDESGSRVSGGVFFARFVADGVRRTERLVVLR